MNPQPKDGSMNFRKKNPATKTWFPDLFGQKDGSLNFLVKVVRQKALLQKSSTLMGVFCTRVLRY